MVSARSRTQPLSVNSVEKNRSSMDGAAKARESTEKPISNYDDAVQLVQEWNEALKCATLERCSFIQFF